MQNLNLLSTYFLGVAVGPVYAVLGLNEVCSWARHDLKHKQIRQDFSFVAFKIQLKQMGG